MKKYRIIFDSLVNQKLENIFDFLIKNESQQTATKVLNDIEKSINSLEFLPNRFSKIFEFNNYKGLQVRNIFCSSFRIIYVVLSEQVRIIDIRHLAMEPLSKKDIIKFYEKT